MNRALTLALLGTLTLGLFATHLLVRSQEEIPKTTTGEHLQVVTSKMTLGIGESAQLTVTLKRADLSLVDVTDDSTGTRYSTTDESMLIPEPDGRITCIGTQGRNDEATNITVVHGDARSRIRLYLQPSGPGSTLEILPKKNILEEGESVRFQVRTRSDKVDVTGRSSGTRYLVFKGYGVPDPDVLHIDDESGVLTAPASLGKYQWLSPIIFVRNGESVGWLELKIVRKRGKNTN